MEDHFLAQVAAAWPAADWSSTTVLVGVSGGADSLALLLALDALRDRGPAGNLAAVHFDHQWRPDSAADARFVEATCASLGIPCRVGRDAARQLGAAPRDEAAARRARYAFFRRTADQMGARYLATGHTRDDQAETVLHRIARGTGLRGLAGIPAFRALSGLTTLARPLLAVDRQAVLDFLKRRGQTWREDATNQLDQYTRNRIRRHTLPALAEHNPQVRGALARLAELASEAQTALDYQSEQLASRAVEAQSPDRCVVDCRTLQSLPDAVRCEWGRWLWRRQAWPEQAMDQRHWRRLAELAGATASGAADFPGQVAARREGLRLTLQRLPTDAERPA